MLKNSTILNIIFMLTFISLQATEYKALLLDMDGVLTQT